MARKRRAGDELWNVLSAELRDVLELSRLEAARKTKCLYCEKETSALSGVCCDHSDLPALEVDETETTDPEGSVTR